MRVECYERSIVSGVDREALEEIREEVAGARRNTLSHSVHAEPEHRLRLGHDRSAHTGRNESVRVSLAIQNRDRLLKPDRALRQRDTRDPQRVFDCLWLTERAVRVYRSQVRQSIELL